MTISPLQYLAFTCGLLAGALTNLGIRCQVTAEVMTMPACELTTHPSPLAPSMTTLLQTPQPHSHS